MIQHGKAMRNSTASVIWAARLITDQTTAPAQDPRDGINIYIYDKVVVVAAAVVIVVTVVKVEMVVTGGIRTSKASANAFSHCVNPIASLPKVAAVVKLQGTDHRRTTEKPTAATSHLLYETLPSCAQEGEKSDIPFGNLCSY